MIYDKTLHTSLFPCPRYINSEMEKDIILRRCRSKRCRDKREWGMNVLYLLLCTHRALVILVDSCLLQFMCGKKMLS